MTTEFMIGEEVAYEFYDATDFKRRGTGLVQDFGVKRTPSDRGLKMVVTIDTGMDAVTTWVWNVRSLATLSGQNLADFYYD